MNTKLSQYRPQSRARIFQNDPKNYKFGTKNPKSYGRNHSSDVICEWMWDNIDMKKLKKYYDYCNQSKRWLWNEASALNYSSRSRWSKRRFSYALLPSISLSIQWFSSILQCSDYENNEPRCRAGASIENSSIDDAFVVHRNAKFQLNWVHLWLEAQNNWCIQWIFRQHTRASILHLHSHSQFG